MKKVRDFILDKKIIQIESVIVSKDREIKSQGETIK